MAFLRRQRENRMSKTDRKFAKSEEPVAARVFLATSLLWAGLGGICLPAPDGRVGPVTEAGMRLVEHWQAGVAAMVRPSPENEAHLRN